MQAGTEREQTEGLGGALVAGPVHAVAGHGQGGDLATPHGFEGGEEIEEGGGGGEFEVVVAVEDVAGFAQDGPAHGEDAEDGLGLALGRPVGYRHGRGG